MKKLCFVLLLILLVSSFALAANPSIISIDTNNFYLNKEGKIILTFDPADTNGKIEFYDNQQLISIQDYSSVDTQKIYNRTYSVTGDRNFLFQLVDINGENTNLLDDKKSMIAKVKSGVDLAVIDITLSQTQIQPGSSVSIIVKTKNLGDENFAGNVNLKVNVDGNFLSEQTIQGLEVGQEKFYSFNWNTPRDFNSAIINAYIQTSGIVYDSSLNNNEKYFTAGSTSLADLFVKDIVTNDSMRRDFLETITIVVANSGGRSVDGAQIEVWRDSQTEDHKIYSNTFNMAGNSEKSLDFVYSFSEVKETSLIVLVNRNKNVVESEYGNNSKTKTIKVFDFNLNSILIENDKLKQEVSNWQAKYNSIDIERQTCMSSLASKRSEAEACASNLSICNSNNNTTISNYMQGIDANRAAEKTIYLGEIERIGREKTDMQYQYTNQINQLTEEKNQWILVIAAIFVCVLGYIVWEEYINKKDRSSVNTNRGN